MKSRVIGDNTWRSLDFEYAHDSSVYFKGVEINSPEYVDEWHKKREKVH